jgi:phosphoesterase RecJ-like protein
MTPRNEALERIVAALQDKHKILVITHVFPDGDALGSQLSLGNILESLGKKIYYYSEAGCSHLYDFLPHCGNLHSDLPDFKAVDAAIAVDCGDRFRLGRHMETLLQIHPFLVIDHHAGHKEFGDISWVDPSRSSTGEMIYDLALGLGAKISQEAAFGMYTAIVSDTGSFKYSSTSARTFRTAAELVAMGVKPSEVAGKLFDNYTVNRLRLLQAVLATLELFEEDKIAMISVTRAILAETSTVPEDTEDFISFPRTLNSVQVAVFLKETAENWVSVSLRSKGTRDVAGIARTFGGGGHRNAAGFRLENRTIDQIRAELLPELKKILT